MEETEAVMDAAAAKPDGSAKDAAAEPGANASMRGSGPTGAFTEVREGMARFRAGQVACLAARDDAVGGIRARPGAAFSNPWADFADRHGPSALQEAMIRSRPLVPLAASLAATAALLLLLGTFGAVIVSTPDKGPSRTVADAVRPYGTPGTE